MARYDMRCVRTGTEVERVCAIAESGDQRCACGAELEILISRTGIQPPAFRTGAIVTNEKGATGVVEGSFGGTHRRYRNPNR